MLKHSHYRRSRYSRSTTDLQRYGRKATQSDQQPDNEDNYDSFSYLLNTLRLILHESDKATRPKDRFSPRSNSVTKSRTSVGDLYKLPKGSSALDAPNSAMCAGHKWPQGSCCGRWLNLTSVEVKPSDRYVGCVGSNTEDEQPECWLANHRAHYRPADL
jgi:hypothetical protein